MCKSVVEKNGVMVALAWVACPHWLSPFGVCICIRRLVGGDVGLGIGAIIPSDTNFHAKITSNYGQLESVAEPLKRWPNFCWITVGGVCHWTIAKGPARKCVGSFQSINFLIGTSRPMTSSWHCPQSRLRTRTSRVPLFRQLLRPPTQIYFNGNRRSCPAHWSTLIQSPLVYLVIRESPPKSKWECSVCVLIRNVNDIRSSTSSSQYVQLKNFILGGWSLYINSQAITGLNYYFSLNGVGRVGNQGQA